MVVSAYGQDCDLRRCNHRMPTGARCASEISTTKRAGQPTDDSCFAKPDPSGVGRKALLRILAASVAGGAGTLMMIPVVSAMMPSCRGGCNIVQYQYSPLFLAWSRPDGPGCDPSSSRCSIDVLVGAGMAAFATSLIAFGTG
jgi:hypothetical protein